MKKKTIILILLPILLLIIAAGTVAALYFMTDIFKSDQELFLKYFSQNKEIISILENENENAQKQFKTQNTYQSTGDLDISIQGDTNTQEVKLTTATRHDLTSGRTYSEMNLKKEDADLLKVSYINSADIYALKSDEIITNYIGIQNSNLKTYMSNMGIGAGTSAVYDIPDSIDFSKVDNLYQLTAEQKQHIEDTYLPLIINTIPKNQYSKLEKTQIEVDHTNYTANAYQLTIDTDTIKAILIDCLTTLKSDNETLVILSNKLSSLGLKSELTDIANMANDIDKIIRNLQNNSSDNKTINIIVYETDGKTLKTIMQQEENEVTIDYIHKDNMQKVDVLMNMAQENNEGNINGEQTSERTTAQMTFQKTTSESNIMHDITIIPDTNHMEQQIIINTTLGSIQNNTINNASTVTLTFNNPSTNQIETISSSYVQNIQAVSQVEEIPELNNTNTVIINNYSIEQLSPFLTNLGARVMQVLPVKIAQLGINIQETTNITNAISAIGTAGISMTSVNGARIETLIPPIATGLGLYKLSTISSPLSSEDLGETDVDTHNMLFSSYEGEKSGSNVQTLCDTVKNYNLGNVNHPSEQVLVQMSSAVNIVTEPTEEITMESIDAIQEQLHSEKNYIVDFGYSATTGKIVAIGITEVK